MRDVPAAKDLASLLSGDIILPESSDYDQVRQLWNGNVNKRPAALAARMPKTLFTPFVGRARMGWRSPSGVEDMILRDEPCATMVS